VTFASDPLLLVDALLALRDPLSRIALATSGGARSGSPEEVRNSEVVSSALADADARIDELVRALAPRGPARIAASADCRAAFADACARAAVAAEARGIALEVAAAPEPIPGDERLVRRAALRLLRVACEWVGVSGSLCVTLSRSSDAVRIACRGSGAAPPARGARLRDLLVRFALAEGVRLSGLASLDTAGLTLQLDLPAREPAA
jgi:hypothetical protein